MGNFSLDNFHYEKQDKTLHSFSTILTTKTVVAWSIVARGSRNSYTNEAAHCAFDLTDWETVSWKYVRLWHSKIHSISHSSQVPNIQKHCSIVCRVRKCDKREWNEIHCVVLMSKNRTNRDGNNNNYVSVKRHHCMPISWTKSFKTIVSHSQWTTLGECEWNEPSMRQAKSVAKMRKKWTYAGASS